MEYQLMAKPDRKPPKKGKRSLRGKGPTPRAEDRPYHKKYKSKEENQRKRTERKRIDAKRGDAKRGDSRRPDRKRDYRRDAKEHIDTVAGRNAVVEALRAGYDEAIMLAPNGLVAECTGENIFCSRNGIILTPPLSAGALEGITQNSVMEIGRDLGIDIRIDNIARSDLYIADEIFVCGTAAEVSAVASVDDRSVPAPGPATTAIGQMYGRVVRGQEAKYAHWCELAK